MKLGTAADFTDSELWRIARTVVADTANEDRLFAAQIQAVSAAAICTGQDPTGMFYGHEGWKQGVDFIFDKCKSALPADATALYGIYYQLKQAAKQHEQDIETN